MKRMLLVRIPLMCEYVKKKKKKKRPTCHERFTVIRGSVALSKRVSTGDTYQRATRR
jgi:hypothetical protein